MPFKAHAENEAVTIFFFFVTIFFAVTIHLVSGAFQGMYICQSTGGTEEP